MNLLKKLLNLIWYLVFPRTCSCCGKNMPLSAADNVCAQCLKTFPENNGLKCAVCSMPLKDGGEHCYDCKHSKIYFNLLKTPYIYKDNIKKLIHKFKYSQRLFLAKDLAGPVADLILKENWDKQADIIIPVPLHFIKKFLRGYNQTSLLAREIAVKINKPFNEKIIVRKSYTKPQFGLNRNDRNENLKNSFSINKKYENILKGKTILLVDDVATTCATANVCAELLKKSGAKKVLVIAIARTEL